MTAPLQRILVRTKDEVMRSSCPIKITLILRLVFRMYAYYVSKEGQGVRRAVATDLRLLHNLRACTKEKIDPHQSLAFDVDHPALLKGVFSME